MKQVGYWDLDQALTHNTQNIDLSILAYEEDVKEALMFSDVIIEDLGKIKLTETAMEYTMDEIGNILEANDIELVFPTMAEVSL